MLLFLFVCFYFVGFYFINAFFSTEPSECMYACIASLLTFVVSYAALARYYYYCYCWWCCCCKFYYVYVPWIGKFWQRTFSSFHTFQVACCVSGKFFCFKTRISNEIFKFWNILWEQKFKSKTNVALSVCSICVGLSEWGWCVCRASVVSKCLLNRRNMAVV